MQFSTKCWSEHILSAYKATKNLKHPLYLLYRLNNESDSQAGAFSDRMCDRYIYCTCILYSVDAYEYMFSDRMRS